MTSIFTMSCNHHYCLIPEHFYHPEEILYLPNLYYFIDRLFANAVHFIYNGNILYVIFCSWLLSLNVMFLSFIHVVACINIHALFWLNNMQLSGYTTFWLFTPLPMDMWIVTLFGYCEHHSSQRTFVWKSLSTCFQFFWVKRIPLKGVELLDKLVSLYFMRNCQLFSTVVYHFTLPPAEYEGFNFSTSSPMFVIFKSFFF